MLCHAVVVTFGKLSMHLSLHLVIRALQPTELARSMYLTVSTEASTATATANTSAYAQSTR